MTEEGEELSVAQAAVELGLKYGTVLAWCRRPGIGARKIRVGHQVVWRLSRGVVDEIRRRQAEHQRGAWRAGWSRDMQRRLRQVEAERDLALAQLRLATETLQLIAHDPERESSPRWAGWASAARACRNTLERMVALAERIKQLGEE